VLESTRPGALAPRWAGSCFAQLVVVRVMPLRANAAAFAALLLGGGPKAVAAASVSDIAKCMFSYDDGTVSATYDLSGLTNFYGAYSITDQYQPSGESFSYYFNVCKNVSASRSIPSNETCILNDEAVDEAAAFQVGGSGSNCRATGVLNGASFQLLSEYFGMGVHPSMGIVLTYTGGHECGLTGVPRTTHIIIECSNSENIPDEEAMEETDRTCDYVLKLPSKVGCPRECPLGGINRQLCSGRGVCGYDVPDSHVRCAGLFFSLLCSLGGGAGAAVQSPGLGTAMRCLPALIRALLRCARTHALLFAGSLLVFRGRLRRRLRGRCRVSSIRCTPRVSLPQMELKRTPTTF
jgi:hypothetical protein